MFYFFGSRGDVDCSSARAMLKTLRVISMGESESAAAKSLDATLSMSGYKLFYKHHNRPSRPNTVPPSEFRRMILSLGDEEVFESDSPRVEYMAKSFRYSISSLDALERKLAGYRKHRLLHKATSIAKDWLPLGVDINARAILVLDGASNGYVEDGSIVLDLLQIEELPNGKIDYEQHRSIIAHELHHVGFSRLLKKNGFEAKCDQRGLAPLCELLAHIVGEGTPTAFINNFPDGLPEIAKADAAKHLKQLDSYRQALNGRIELAAAGHYTQKDMYDDLNTFWLKGTMGPCYVLGSVMMSAIYDHFGKEGVFSVLKDPLLLPRLYDEARPSNNYSGVICGPR
jgi:Putative zinc dependent peptidase (DUF5700)